MFSEIYNWLSQNSQLWLSQQLNNNDFLIGFLATGLLGLLGYLLRSVPRKIYRFLHDLLSVTIVINNDNLYSYIRFNDYLVNRVLWTKLQRNFRMEWSTTRNRHITGPGYGTSFGNIGWVPVLISKHAMESAVAETVKEQVTITLYSRRQATFDFFVKELQEHLGLFERSEHIKVMTPGGGGWFDGAIRPFRHWSTIFIPTQLEDSICRHLDRFLIAETAYAQIGMPYHTGIFLHGEPGCGKSSMIHVIASHLRRDICYLNLTQVMGDTHLMSLMSEMDCGNSILVIEDIDAHQTVQVSRFDEDGDPLPVPAKPLSLSTIMNMLDGIITPHGMIVIATSNHLERLDAALTRAGRFDLVLEVGKMEWQEFKAMAQVMELDVEYMRNSYSPIPAVEARNKLLELRPISSLTSQPHSGQSPSSSSLPPTRRRRSYGEPS